MKRESKPTNQADQGRDVTPLRSRIQHLRAEARNARREEAFWSGYAEEVESTLTRCERQIATPACFHNVEADDHRVIER